MIRPEPDHDGFLPELDLSGYLLVLLVQSMVLLVNRLALVFGVGNMLYILIHLFVYLVNIHFNGKSSHLPIP